jgi:hypothetical protein
MSKQASETGCKTCIHAKWQYDKAGRINHHRVGECTVAYDLSEAPWCVQKYYDFRLNPPRRAISVGDGLGCWHHKESEARR